MPAKDAASCTTDAKSVLPPTTDPESATTALGAVPEMAPDPGICYPNFFLKPGLDILEAWWGPQDWGSPEGE